MRTITSCAFVLLNLFVIMLPEASPTLAAGAPGELASRVNELRVARHLNPLLASEKLSRVAQQHAEDMAQGGYLSHHNREGRNPLERVQAAGVQGFHLLAENIGESTDRGDRILAVLDAWLSSVVHRENLLNPVFNQTGVGSAQAADGRSVFVQLFATFGD